jgi:DNA repair ATPase RecN
MKLESPRSKKRRKVRADISGISAKLKPLVQDLNEVCHELKRIISQEKQYLRTMRREQVLLKKEGLMEDYRELSALTNRLESRIKDTSFLLAGYSERVRRISRIQKRGEKLMRSLP